MIFNKIEPLLGQLPSIHKRGEQPPWVAEAANDYLGVTHRPDAQTSFLRGGPSIEILTRIVPELQHRPNILLVGLGFDADPLLCCYEPFRVAAHLEGMGVDFKMTLVDVNPQIINDVASRTRLFVSCSQYGGDLRKNLEEAWAKYLANTGQTNTVVTERQEGLNFYPYLENDIDGWSYKDYLKQGIYAADVSNIFRTKRMDGDIRLVLGDIATADLGDTMQFDYVECTNVLYLMTSRGQQLALANIVQSMAKGGLVFINDIGGYTGTPVFKGLGGWLDMRKLNQLGLKVEKMEKKKNSQSALLRKFA